MRVRERWAPLIGASFTSLSTIGAVLSAYHGNLVLAGLLALGVLLLQGFSLWAVLTYGADAVLPASSSPASTQRSTAVGLVGISWGHETASFRALETWMQVAAASVAAGSKPDEAIRAADAVAEAYESRCQELHKRLALLSQLSAPGAPEGEKKG